MQKLSTLVVSTLLLIGTGLSQTLQRSTGMYRQRPAISVVKETAPKTSNFQKEETVLKTPFVENFSAELGANYEEKWKERWTCTSYVNAYSSKGYGEPGNIMLPKTDPLVSKPIEIAQGKTHISLYAKYSGRQTDSAMLLLWYGTSPEITEMNLIDSIKIDFTDFTQVLRYFEVTEDSRYYIALQAKGSSFGNAIIDALEIAAGDYMAQPILSVFELQPPMPGCEGKAGIKTSIGNQGAEDAYGLRISYTVNNGEPVMLEFKDTIKAGESKTIEISDIPLPADGANHVKVSASEYPFLAGTQTAYNYLFTPPHTFDFSKYEMIDKAGIDDGQEYLFPAAWQSLDSYSTEEIIDSIKYTIYPESPFMSGCIALEANALYEIMFDYRGGLDNGKEFQRGKLLIGKAGSDWTTWDIIWHDSLVPVNWQSKKVEVSVPQSGQYAIAFVKGGEPGISIQGKIGGDQGTIGLQIKNVSIGLAKAPDIYLSNLILPMSACDLDEEIEISFVCQNKENLPIKGFSAWYSINDTLRVEEFFDTILEATKTTTLSFSQKALLPLGKNIVQVGISGVKDSPQKRTINHWLPAHTPYNIDLNNGDMVGNYGWFFENTSWNSSTATYAVGYNEMDPVRTRCFSLKSNTSYRISFTYHAGSILFNAQRIIPDECMLFVYPVGNDWKEGERIWYEPEVLSGSVWESTEIEFKIKTDGEYAFAFALGKTSYGGLYLRDISISEVLDYDVRLEAGNAIASLMPLDQMNALASTDFCLKNRGQYPIEKVHIEALLNESSVGQTEFTGLIDTVFGQIEMNIRNVKIGDTGVLKIQASIIGHEEEDVNPDHEAVYSFITTDTVMSHYESDTVGGNGIGFNKGTAGNGIGMPFVFRIQDTLTSISVGWAELTGYIIPDIQLVIHSLSQDYQTLGEIVYSTTVHRQKEAGWYTYPVPDLKLYGTYFVEVVQLSVSNYGIATEKEGTGYFYKHFSGENKLIKQMDLGTPAIRLNLGHHGKPSSSKDIAAEAFIEPFVSVGAFAVNQPIRVKVQNHGSDIYPSAKVYCSVNGKLVGQTEVSLRPYVSTEAVFTADLSLPETTYEICAFTALPEDENRSNDTVRLTLHTLPVADPYVMDFEHCGDFAINNFEPAWTTLDEDGDNSYGWDGISFPHTYEAFGFMAFNPYNLTPMIDVEQTPEIAPFQGQRFGASFTTLFGIANDWLISPKLRMPVSGSQISFYVKSFTSTYGYDQYEVKVSETDNRPASFKTVGGLREAPSWEWTQVKVDLSEYNGKEVYVAINRTQPEEFETGFLFMIDDIRISQTGTPNEKTELEQQLSLYPNPARNEIYVFAAGMEMEKVEILNLGGQKVFATAQNFHQNGFRLNVANYQPGIYFARVQAAGKQAVLRFSVIH